MVRCPVCQYNGAKLIWKEKKYRVFKCLKCKIAFLNPVPSEIEKIYQKEYFERWYLKYYGERKRYFEKLIEKLNKFLPEKGKLLDIGCGVGIFLDLMKEKGYEVYGQDISTFAVKYCEEKGYKIFKGNFLGIKISEKFDVITMFDVIAHLQQPLEYLKKCKKLLKPKGVLIIKTPYHNDFLFTIARIISFTGKSKSLLHIPAQIFHFNKTSLEKLSELSGFLKISVFTIKEFFSSDSFLNFHRYISIIEKAAIYIGNNE